MVYKPRLGAKIFGLRYLGLFPFHSPPLKPNPIPLSGPNDSISTLVIDSVYWDRVQNQTGHEK